MNQKSTLIILLTLIAVLIVGCDRAPDPASQNVQELTKQILADHYYKGVPSSVERVAEIKLHEILVESVDDKAKKTEFSFFWSLNDPDKNRNARTTVRVKGIARETTDGDLLVELYLGG